MPRIGSLVFWVAASILGSCGGAVATEPAPSTETSATATAGDDAAVDAFPGIPLDPARAVASLDAAERRALVDWIHANAPYRDVTCPDGVVRSVGVRAEDPEATLLPPASAPGERPACPDLTVGDAAGCQYFVGQMDPCDEARVGGAWAPTGACGGIAACSAAMLDGG